jgi:hypothetical protein
VLQPPKGPSRSLHALLPGRVPWLWLSTLGAESFRPGSYFLFLGADGIGLLNEPPVSWAWAPFMKPKRLSASLTSTPIVDSTSGYIGCKIINCKKVSHSAALRWKTLFNSGEQGFNPRQWEVVPCTSPGGAAAPTPLKFHPVQSPFKQEEAGANASGRVRKAPLGIFCDTCLMYLKDEATGVAIAGFLVVVQRPI